MSSKQRFSKSLNSVKNFIINFANLEDTKIGLKKQLFSLPSNKWFEYSSKSLLFEESFRLSGNFVDRTVGIDRSFLILGSSLLLGTYYFVSKSLNFPTSKEFRRIIKQELNLDIGFSSKVNYSFLINSLLLASAPIFYEVDVPLTLNQLPLVAGYDLVVFSSVFLLLTKIFYGLFKYEFNNAYEQFKNFLRNYTSSKVDKLKLEQKRMKEGYFDFKLIKRQEQKLSLTLEDLLLDRLIHDDPALLDINLKEAYLFLDSSKFDFFVYVQNVKDFTDKKAIGERLFDILSKDSNLDSSKKLYLAWYAYLKKIPDYERLFSEVVSEELIRSPLKKLFESTDVIKTFSKEFSIGSSRILVKQSSDKDSLFNEYLMSKIAEDFFFGREDYLHIPVFGFKNKKDHALFSVIRPDAEIVYDVVDKLPRTKLPQLFSSAWKLWDELSSEFSSHPNLSLKVIDLYDKLLADPISDDANYRTIVSDRIAILNDFDDLRPGLDFHLENLLLKNYLSKYFLGKIDHADKGVLPAIFDLVNLYHYAYDKLNFDTMLDLMNEGVSEYSKTFEISPGQSLIRQAAGLAYRRDSFFKAWTKNDSRKGRLEDLLKYTPAMFDEIKKQVPNSLHSWLDAEKDLSYQFLKIIGH